MSIEKRGEALSKLRNNLHYRIITHLDGPPETLAKLETAFNLVHNLRLQYLDCLALHKLLSESP